MSRVRLVLAASFLAASMVGGGGAIAGAADQAAADASSCASQSWPTKLEAKGQAFVGRVEARKVNSLGNVVYRFDVLSTKQKAVGGAGFRDRVWVELTTCAKTGFKIGERYLVSSSFGSGHDGYTSKVGFGNDYGVAWHVFPSNKVTLMGYGPGTQRDNVPDWLSAPKTLRQASVAIRL